MEKPHEETQGTAQGERRFLTRHLSKAAVVVYRDSDMMRAGIEGRAKDISSAGVGILITTPMNVEEKIKVTLINDTQRFQKEVRGVVRHCTPRDDGYYHVGVELYVRLAPLEVRMLSMGIESEGEENENSWI